MRILSCVALIFVLVFQSCCTTKKDIEADHSTTTSQLKNTKTKVLNDRMKKEGYTFGEVEYQEDSDCTYVIIDKYSPSRYDAVNFDADNFLAFKKDGLKIYFKFKPLRMQNRCPDALPIKLISVKKGQD